MQNQATPQASVNARTLRRDMTDAERKLWSGLRGKQLGFKFRRQHPLGPYIADFACLEPKLIVELDGSQHADNRRYDEARDAFIKAQGFAVPRFPSNAPFQNLDGVLSAILHSLNKLAGVAPIPAFPARLQPTTMWPRPT
jgi:very-short-patch-repair endonuclease